ncbi:Leucine-rich repeat (LRR) family protein [Abeliophyllum distichum]|uniref:Leucine-rich repeat (LRR) family protein n=1 Tax=Abeliophyllum distichum TaxID=126358 RepID=A0ABD1SF06_9LAMI
MWCLLKKKRDYRFIYLIHFIFFLLECSFLVDAILDPINFLALQSIRKSLDDLPGSNHFASWDFTSNPCNFAGVYCDGDKVKALMVGKNEGVKVLVDVLHGSNGDDFNSGVKVN